MGHAENKCEIRFSMEHDDGTREWTAEIRADSRRQGGRFASKWLKEERGGGVEEDGGGAAGPSQNPVDNPIRSSTLADVASGLETNNHNSPIINHAAITSRQTQLLAVNGNRTPHSQVFTLTQNIGDLPQILNGQTNPLAIPTFPAFIPSNSVTQTTPIPSLFPPDKQLNSVPNIHSPIILTQPITENNNIPSITHIHQPSKQPGPTRY
jgi:hypothetical protein